MNVESHIPTVSHKGAMTPLHKLHYTNHTSFPDSITASASYNLTTSTTAATTMMVIMMIVIMVIYNHHNNQEKRSTSVIKVSIFADIKIQISESDWN